MGQISSVLFLDDTDTQYMFVGRKEDKSKFKQLIETKRIILIYGMKKVGKSRFFANSCKSLDQQNIQYICQDFTLFNIDNAKAVHRLFVNLFGKFAESVDDISESDFKACGSCAMCNMDKGKEFVYEKCNTLHGTFETLVSKCISCLNETEKQTIFFLDNVDEVMDSKMKDYFMKFLIKTAESCQNVRFVLTSTVKLKYTGKLYDEMELKPLEPREIKELLNDIIKDKSYIDKNPEVIQCLANLCDGLPLAATIIGSELCDNNGLMKPIDLAQVLILHRLEVLSPDNYCADERLNAVYEKNLVKFQDLFSNLKDNFTRRCPNMGAILTKLNKSMEGSKFKIEDMTGVGKCFEETIAMVKFDIIKPGLEHGVFSFGDDSVTFHSILQECKHQLDMLYGSRQEGDIETVDTTRERFVKESAAKAGLTLDKSVAVLTSRTVEAFLNDQINNSNNEKEKPHGSLSHTQNSECVTGVSGVMESMPPYVDLSLATKIHELKSFSIADNTDKHAMDNLEIDNHFDKEENDSNKTEERQCVYALDSKLHLEITLSSKSKINAYTSETNSSQDAFTSKVSTENYQLPDNEHIEIKEVTRSGLPKSFQQLGLNNVNSHYGISRPLNTSDVGIFEINYTLPVKEQQSGAESKNAHLSFARIIPRKLKTSDLVKSVQVGDSVFETLETTGVTESLQDKGQDKTLQDRDSSTNNLPLRVPVEQTSVNSQENASQSFGPLLTAEDLDIKQTVLNSETGPMAMPFNASGMSE